MRTTAHSVAAEVVSRHSQVLRYVAALLDISVFDSDERTGFSPRFLQLCTDMHAHVSTWSNEHLTPHVGADGDASATVTAEEVLALRAYLGPDIVIEQLDHGNQHLWLTCPRHYDTKIALVMDFSDQTRFEPSTLSTDQINLLYTERAFALRRYGLRPCSADVTLETFAPPTRRQTRRN